MRSKTRAILILGGIAAALGVLASCGGSGRVHAKDPGESDSGNGSAEISVGVVKVVRKNLGRTLTVSSELVPFQEIDVYAKESGFVKQLNVDYGSHVQANQVLATLEIPELQLQVKEDDATVKNAAAQIPHAQEELNRVQAQQKVLQLQYERLNSVAQSKPGLVAQQEVDDSQGKALASSAQVEAAKSNLQSAESVLAAAEAKREHDQALFDYSKITAPFAGVVTQRYANLGTLMQAGTNSSTQALPLVRLSQDDLFRLVIPVPESYVHFIHLGDPVSVNVPSLNRTFPGKVARFSVDVREDTRTMHTEVDVPNPQRVLLPGLYADAVLQFDRKVDVPTVPIQAIAHEGDKATVLTVDGSGTLQERTVQIGLETSAYAQVLAGLNEGEQVVVSDRSGLKVGEKVHAQPVAVIEYQEKDQ